MEYIKIDKCTICSGVTFLYRCMDYKLVMDSPSIHLIPLQRKIMMSIKCDVRDISPAHCKENEE